MKIELNQIYNVDCLEGMSNMNENAVDFVITSPPYNVNNNIRGKFYDEYEDNKSEEEYFQFISKVISECIRVSKYYVFFNFQILKDNKHTYLKLLHEFSRNIKDIIIWEKNNVQPSIQPNMLNSKFEFVIVFSKEVFAKSRCFEKCKFNNRQRFADLNNNIFSTNSASSENFEGREINKAIFPESFVYWFIKKFISEDEIVLDPFMGLGTTAKVCKEHKINYIGFELSKQYCNIANNRLSKITESKITNWFNK